MVPKQELKVINSIMSPTLIPYLYFNGETADAMKFYHSILGGELNMQTFGEAGVAQTPADQNRVIHAELKNEFLSFMASDGRHGQMIKFGDNIHLSVSGSEKEKLTDYFNGLAKGGRVDMHLSKQFWGDVYGMLTDKYGIHWMINITQQ